MLWQHLLLHGQRRFRYNFNGNTVSAETKFLRALDYFDLVRIFGGVPLITESTASLDDLYAERNEPAQIYDQVINDLQDAETVLP